MSGPDIFISYNREDAAFAQAYADAFTDAGLVVWWDATLRSGEDYDAVTEDALRKSKAVVVLWSPRSVSSRWVRAEATIADRGQRLMPVMIEDCERPVMFELKQTTDMAGWIGDTTDPRWTAFIADVSRRIGKTSGDAVRPLRPVARPAGSAPSAPAPAAESAAPPPAAPVAERSDDDRAAVAVLPFSSRGGDADLELQGEDLTEDLTRELAYNRYLRVIAAGTMAAWRGKPIEHKSLGRQLDARYLVEGKLQPSGASTRLTVQLVDGDSGNVLWSNRMLSNADDPEFGHDALPVAIALQLAEQIVTREESRAMARKAPYSANDRILRASALTRREDEGSAKAAVDEARLAVEAGPDSGLAHAILASALASLAEARGTTPDAEQIREIQTTTRQAMRLDGNNPTVLMALAGAYQGLGEYEICLRLARRTVDLWPNAPTSHRILADSLRMLGRTAEAIEAYRRQDKLGPYDSSRHVALTNLGMCLLLEGQVDEAEAALDQALMLNPEYPVALEWKAIVAEHLGKHAAALAAVRQIRATESVMPLERHVWQIERFEALRDRTAPHAATLRRLWSEAGGESSPAPERKSEPAGEPVKAREPAAKPAKAAPVAASAAAAAAQVDVIDEPAPEFPVADVEPAEALMFAAAPAEAAPAAEPLVNQAQPAAPAALPVAAAPAASATAAGAKKSGVPRIAMLVGVLAVVGTGAAAMLRGGGGSSDGPAAPGFSVGSSPVSAGPAAVAAAAGVVPAALTELTGQPQQIGQAMAELVAAARNARRPAGEIAALEAGQQSMLPLLTQLQTAPTDMVIAGHVRDIVKGAIQPQGAALAADANRWIAEQERVAARAPATPEVAASVARALGKVRAPRADLNAAIATASQAPDALAAIASANKALGAYSRIRSVSVAPAIASANASAKAIVANAAADTAKAQNKLSMMRVDLGNARSELAHIYTQAAGMAQQEKAGLFASGSKRQSAKLRKDNADRIKALLGEADQIVGASQGVSDPGALSASLSRIRGLKSQAASMVAASSASLKNAGAPETSQSGATKN